MEENLTQLGQQQQEEMDIQVQEEKERQQQTQQAEVGSIRDYILVVLQLIELGDDMLHLGIKDNSKA